MECPACGSPRSPLEKECPRCVYIANTLREHKQKQQMQSSPAKTVAMPEAIAITREATVAAPTATVTPETIVAASPAVALPTFFSESKPTSEAVPAAYTALISIMWTLTAVQLILLSLGQLKPPTPFLLEPPGIFMAILLVVSPNRINRWNGVAKLVLEGIGLVIFALLWKMPAMVSR